MTLGDESIDSRAPARSTSGICERGLCEQGRRTEQRQMQQRGTRCGSELDRRLTHGIELRSAPITTAVLGP